jgi:hypothetical protein
LLPAVFGQMPKLHGYSHVACDLRCACASSSTGHCVDCAAGLCHHCRWPFHVAHLPDHFRHFWDHRPVRNAFRAAEISQIRKRGQGARIGRELDSSYCWWCTRGSGSSGKRSVLRISDRPAEQVDRNPLRWWQHTTLAGARRRRAQCLAGWKKSGNLLPRRCRSQDSYGCQLQLIPGANSRAFVRTINNQGLTIPNLEIARLRIRSSSQVCRQSRCRCLIYHPDNLAVARLDQVGRELAARSRPLKYLM